MKELLIVWHSQFGGTAQMAAAAHDGATSVPDIVTTYVEARHAGVSEFQRCNALLLATSENFGSLSGATKDFLERVFYPCEHAMEGKPYTVIVCAGSDGQGAMLQTDRIITGLRMRKVLPGIVYRSGVTAQAQTIPATTLAQCRELGATLAAGLAAGIY
ncbi:MAG: NAD(P)H-dependent oxidoreductase [Betaproteobacteria bacterium]